MKNILLVEPNYKTKFPPLGLMKISTYHKLIGDRVFFVKGISQDVPYEYWDRIYITTLFTYHWNIIIETIKYYKYLVRDDSSRIYVGGIMASLMAKELWQETGLIPVVGLLNKKNPFGDENDLIIDEMVPDYNLFEDSDVKYNLLNSYFGYSTRGCVHKCGFCGVHLLEPEFVDYNGFKEYVKKVEQQFGTKQHLVFFDNNILASKKFDQIINDIIDLGFEKDSRFNNKLRHVDFNQGVDARLMKESHIKLISKIAINPLRIAFDHIKYKKIYCAKVTLAAKYGIRNLSNYILYNYNDTPEDFWNRLKINIDLNKKHDLQIYSFPMKFIPLMSKDRSYIKKPEWNWVFLRNIQRILNVNKGSVMAGEEFFSRAFGENEKEFLTILHMPENILMYRGRTPKHDEIDWKNKFNKLTQNEKIILLDLLCQNKSKKMLELAISKLTNLKIKNILSYYLPPKDENSLRLFE